MRKNWERPECDCCYHYSDECRQGACIWEPKIIKKAEKAYYFYHVRNR